MTRLPAWSGQSAQRRHWQNDNILNGIAATVTSTGVIELWAVGYYKKPNATLKTLTEMGNSGAWVIVVSPNTPVNDVLNSVTYTAPPDTWAVGYSVNAAGNDRTLTEFYC